MNSIGIDTTQNVSLNYTLAGVGSRIGAFLIDYLILIAFILMCALVGTQLPFVGLGFAILIVLSALLYFLVSEIVMNGQTIGKKVLNIKVVKLDGSKPTIGAYLLRWVAFPLDFGFFGGGIAILSIVVTEKGQRLGDLLAGTTVVKLKSSSVHQLQKKRALVQVKEGYEPVYTQAEFITDEEVRLMDKAIKAFNMGGTRGPMESLHQKIKEKYQIESKDMPIRFFTTLQKDHAYYEREKEASLKDDMT
jgi:uncharacterized RDD family membrane protein YckC